LTDIKIIADSIGENGQRLTTMQLKFHRFVLSEFNTHRVFSRNASSSRAIPVQTLMKRMKEDPAIPVKWGKNQKGMQAGEFYTIEEALEIEKDWLKLRDMVMDYVQTVFLDKWDLHKQIANRPLESWMWSYVVVTATQWNNFMNLRCHPDAQPEIEALAQKMRLAYDTSVPRRICATDWHLPYILQEDEEEAWDRAKNVPLVARDLLLKVSTARCARVSYKTHDGFRPSFEKDVELHDHLIYSGHMSPTEHAAQFMDDWQFYGNFRGFRQYRKLIPNEDVFRG